MKERIAQKVQGTIPSMTLKLSEVATKLAAEGHQVISFGTGEPDYTTPDHICEAGKQAIDEGHTKYDAVAGLQPLRKAVQDKLLCENHLDYKLEQIVITSGAKSALFVTLQAILDPGDEVIIPAPYWVSYTEMVKLAGGVPVIVSTKRDNGFKLRPDELILATTDKTKAIMLNTPSNPTGIFYDEAELRELAEVIVETDIFVLSDEIYEDYVYTRERPVSIASLGDEIAERTIVINGFSKTFAMTGWRLGYLAAPKDVARAIVRIQGHTLSHPALVSQYAGLEAMVERREVQETVRTVFEERREKMVERLDLIPELDYIFPDATFYIFVDVTGIIDLNAGISSAMEFCEELLAKGHVVTIPGEAFGVENFVRFSFATNEENIDEGFDRIEAFVRELRRRAALED